MRKGDIAIGAASALLFVAGGLGLYEAEHNHNAVAEVCYTQTGQPVPECNTQPAESLRHRIDQDVDLFLVLGALGLATGGAGLLHTLDNIGRPDDGPGDTKHGHTLPFKPRS